MIRNALLALGLIVAAVAGPVVGTEPTAVAAADFGTLAQRNAYIRCVAPSSGVTLKQRILMLNVAQKALEGIRGGVPSSTVIISLDRLYPITREEARKAYWCTMKVWG